MAPDSNCLRLVPDTYNYMNYFIHGYASYEICTYYFKTILYINIMHYVSHPPTFIIFVLWPTEFNQFHLCDHEFWMIHCILVVSPMMQMKK